MTAQIPPIPILNYTSKAIFSKELVNIFGKKWIYAAPSSTLNQPGAYRTFDFGPWPLFVMRDPRSEDLVGYLNICPHRGGNLLPHNEIGILPQKFLRCQYHGFCFHCDSGNLFKTPRVKDPEYTLDPLRKIHVEESNGLVYFNMGMNPVLSNEFTEFPEFETGISPSTSLSEHLGSLSSQPQFNFDDFILFSNHKVDLQCNWKVYIENYQDYLHIPTMHPGLNSNIQFKTYVVENFDDGEYSLHHCESKSPDSPGGLWAWHFPNLAINKYDSYFANMESVIPISVSNTTQSYDYLVHKSHVDDTEKLESYINMSLQVTQEDKDMVHTVQKNLNSGGFYVPKTVEQDHSIEHFWKIYHKSME